jgi:homoserine kinase
VVSDQPSSTQRSGRGSPIGAEVVVPGSTSNLGAGFDALGLALTTYLRARIVAVDEDQPFDVTQFTFAGLTLEGENSIERALRAAAAKYGTTLPALRVEVSSDIPLKAGLGSSAAAIVAGIRLYEAIAGPLPIDEVLTMAASLEGHPDNPSASILGGLIVGCQREDGRVIAVATRWPASIRVIVATPSVGLETKVARAALPASIDRKDAIFNLQRSTLLVQAIAAASAARSDALRREVRDAVREAVRDRLHQPYRASLVPGLARALAFEHPQLLGVFLSGAGPSIAAFTDGDAPDVAAMFRALYQELGLACTVRALDVHQPDEPIAEPGR